MLHNGFCRELLSLIRILVTNNDNDNQTRKKSELFIHEITNEVTQSEILFFFPAVDSIAIL
jgi:hypothetical protein